MEIIKQIARNEYVGNDLNEQLNKVLYITIEDIKKDSEGYILSIIERLSFITFSDEPSKALSEGKTKDEPSKDETQVIPSLYKLYIDSKEIVMSYRKEPIKGMTELSNIFNLSVGKYEMIYFLMIMYQVSLKLNDTFPMIPGLYKNMFKYTLIGKWYQRAIEYLFDERTDWKEMTEEDSTTSFEHNFSYCSMNNIEFKGIVVEPKTTIYINEINKNKITIYDERKLFSKYIPLKHKLIVFQ